MSATRRFLVLIALTLAVIVGSGIPASATFTESASVPGAAVTTLTVQPPTAVAVDDRCVTTTTTTKRTVRTDPVTFAQTQTAYSVTTTYADSTTNVQGTTSSTMAGPGAYEQTTTTIAKNTNLHVTLKWTASTSPEVTGYLVSAHLGAYNGTVTPLLGTAATTITAAQDADNLALQPSLIVSTQTAYGWTKDAARTAVLSC